MFSSRSKPSRVRFPTFYCHFSLQFTLLCALTGDSWGNRTPVAGVRGRSLNRLTNEPFTRGQRLLCSIASVLVHHQGLEPGTHWLRVSCSTNWANGAYPLAHSKSNNENSTFQEPKILWSSPRPISTPELNVSPHLHSEPIYLVVFKGSYLINSVGYLILWSASCLDAFSVYPIRT